MESEKVYSHQQVLSIISRLHATTTDYLIQTYFEIFKINEGPFYEKFQRRFNNLIFNNLNKIVKELTFTVYKQKAHEILVETLTNTTYLSCIFPHNLKPKPCPIFLQYFNPNFGIEHRLVGYTPSPLGLSTILAQHNIVNKLVGYCGDFLYNDPGMANHKSDHFSSLCLLSGNSIKYLPYCDGFVDILFDLLVDYLPEDVTVSLMRLGETFLRMSSKSKFAQDLVNEYRKWLENGHKPHILSSDYTKYVIEHFGMINCYLEPFQCLARSIEALLCNVLQRFLLVFMRDLYLKVNEIELSDNCAVMYYHQLVRIKNLFKLFEDNHYIPPKALECFNKEIEFLIDNHVLDPNKDKSKIDDLFKEILTITRTCFTRALQYINPLLEKFANFDTFTWILLENSSIDQNQVHQTFHTINNENCSSCPKLLEEIREINLVLSKFPLLEMEGSVVSKWISIFKNCQQIPIVTKLLEYLLALPASYDLMDDGQNCEYFRVKTMIQFNMKRISDEEIVDNIEEFLDRHIALARNIINNHQIPSMTD